MFHVTCMDFRRFSCMLHEHDMNMIVICMSKMYHYMHATCILWGHACTYIYATHTCTYTTRIHVHIRHACMYICSTHACTYTPHMHGHIHIIIHYKAMHACRNTHMHIIGICMSHACGVHVTHKDAICGKIWDQKPLHF